MICKICQQEYKEDKHFWKSHKIRVADYFHKYEPRYDKLTGDLIKFKSRDFYLTSSFNEKINFKIWLNQVTRQEAREYVENYLSNRLKDGKLNYSLTQVELRSLMVPGIKWINENIGDYYEFCEKIGIKKRFTQYHLDKRQFKDISSKVIFADKREQQRLDFNLTTRNKSMSYGDYRMANCDIYVERKSLADFFSSFGYSYERLEKEVRRAQEAKSYLVILVEEPFETIYHYPFRKQVYGKVKISPEVPLFHVRELLQKYKNIQFLFVNNRDEASRIIELIFSAGEQIKNTDLQFLHDTKQLL